MMPTKRLRQEAPLGELVVAAFDQAAHYSSDQREVARLATKAIWHLLERVQKHSTSAARHERVVVRPKGGPAFRKRMLQRHHAGRAQTAGDSLFSKTERVTRSRRSPRRHLELRETGVPWVKAGEEIVVRRRLRTEPTLEGEIHVLMLGNDVFLVPRGNGWER
jgi:hypothetical protein